MEVKSKKDFINYWNKFFKEECECKDHDGNIVSIGEIEEGGRGVVWLKFERKSSELLCHFNPPRSSLHIKCMKNPKIPDGLVFKVDFEQKIANIYIVELKKTITYKLQDVALQLEKILFFIRSLGIDGCFDMKFLLVIAYENCNACNMSNFLMNVKNNDYLYTLYSAFMDAMKGQNALFPIKLPFCPYIKLELKVTTFNTEIELS